MKQITTTIFKYLVVESLAEPTILMEQSGTKCSGLHLLLINHRTPVKDLVERFCESPILFGGATVCPI